MRLLDVETYELVDFTLVRPIPKYAILSHTWGEEEVSFADLVLPNCSGLKGWTKVENTCRLAREDGYAYVWIDTCCIDKSSSAELSEAINSMFAWYQESAVCYVALSDVCGKDVEQLMVSRWWTRGWTLQELLAPATLIFYDSNWDPIGQRQDYVEEITRITRIPQNILETQEDRATIIARESIATRMSWASERETTRLEDEAYCLMGIFGVNMSLIYGEGRKAFQRLQYEIIRTTTDLSFLAHESTDVGNLLARSAGAFKEDFGFRLRSSSIHGEHGELSLTNQGLKVQSVTFYPKSCCVGSSGYHYCLPVAGGPDAGADVHVCFRRVDSKQYVRQTQCHTPGYIEYRSIRTEAAYSDEDITLLFEDNGAYRWGFWPFLRRRIQLPHCQDLKLRESFVYPPSAWNWETYRIQMPDHDIANRFFAITGRDNPFVIVIQTSSVFGSTPVGYFLYERNHMLGLTAGIRRTLLRNDQYSNFQRQLHKIGRRSIRYVERGGTTTFIIITFEEESWGYRMGIKHVTKPQHYRTKVKDFWLRNLPSSAKRLKDEPCRHSKP